MFEFGLLEVGKAAKNIPYELPTPIHNFILPKILFLGVIFDFTTQQYTNFVVTSSSIYQNLNWLLLLCFVDNIDSFNGRWNATHS